MLGVEITDFTRSVGAIWLLEIWKIYLYLNIGQYQYRIWEEIVLLERWIRDYNFIRPKIHWIAGLRYRKRSRSDMSTTKVMSYEWCHSL
ncbi:MAG: hypothetical protein CME33_25630 [Gimesia sp.]|nr:hypothetical protein [Gimesia sp.]